jgi:hypothetical protein
MIVPQQDRVHRRDFTQIDLNPLRTGSHFELLEAGRFLATVGYQVDFPRTRLGIAAANGLPEGQVDGALRREKRWPWASQWLFDVGNVLRDRRPLKGGWRKFELKSHQRR